MGKRYKYIKILPFMLINCNLYQEELSLGRDFLLSYFFPPVRRRIKGEGGGVSCNVSFHPKEQDKRRKPRFCAVVLFVPTPTCPAS
jgi:hypothetical protein